MAPLILGYWNIRGLGQPIRLFLGYLGVDFEDKRYGRPPLEMWFDVKENLGLDFPNIPYLIDGDVKITQSNAILRYIARKHNMAGKTEEERVRVDIMENQGMDFRNGFIELCYRSTPEGWPESKRNYLIKTKVLLRRFDKFLGNRKYFAGDELTFVDFFMYEILEHHRIFNPPLFDKDVDNLNAFSKRFEEVPEIAAFMKSDKFFIGDINAPHSHFYKAVTPTH